LARIGMYGRTRFEREGLSLMPYSYCVDSYCVDSATFEFSGRRKRSAGMMGSAAV
jgi:hypothetical protein